MILLSIKELIPFSAFFILNTYKLPWNILILLIMPFIAIFLIYLSNHKINNTNSLYKVGVLSMIILLIHNIPEGIVTFMSSLTNKELGLKLGIAIMAHNIPEGICIGVPIYFATRSRGRAFLYTFISGIAEPLGGLLIYILFRNYINFNIINILLYFIGSLMLLISFKEILPEINKYNNKNWFIVGLFLSFFILFL